MKPLDMEGCKRIAARTTATVEFPGNEVSVTVRRLSLEESKQVSEAASVGDGEAFPRAAVTLMMSLAIVGADGKQTFNTDEGRAQLEQLPEGMRNLVRNELVTLMGLDGVGLKNS